MFEGTMSRPGHLEDERFGSSRSRGTRWALGAYLYFVCGETGDAGRDPREIRIDATDGQ
jgi:hypothetical protein